jgi:hypothetical protein
MLFDFYGELLTEKQREYYELHCNATCPRPRLPRRRDHAAGRLGYSAARPRTPAGYEERRALYTLYGTAGDYNRSARRSGVAARSLRRDGAELADQALKRLDSLEDSHGI